MATLDNKHDIEAMRDGQGSVIGWVVDDSRGQTCNGGWSMNATTESKLPERAPAAGELVHVRSRRWLVEEVAEPQADGESFIVRLACADDDAQGQSLAVFWSYELDRGILHRTHLYRQGMLTVVGRQIEPNTGSAHMAKKDVRDHRWAIASPRTDFAAPPERTQQDCGTPPETSNSMASRTDDLPQLFLPTTRLTRVRFVNRYDSSPRNPRIASV